MIRCGADHRPRKCGIGTFTSNLQANGLALKAAYVPPR